MAVSISTMEVTPVSAVDNFLPSPARVFTSESSCGVSDDGSETT
jgi:hypothetical protein